MSLEFTSLQYIFIPKRQWIWYIYIYIYIYIVGGKDLSFCVGFKASFTNNNESKKEEMLGKTP